MSIAMNDDVRARWVQALNSGEYLQGNGCLKSDVPPRGEPRYCCLGVLCDLYLQDHHEDEQWHPREGTDRYSIFDTDPRRPAHADRRDSYLPSQVSEWAGINESDQYHLASLNDSQVTFPTIAKIINNEAVAVVHIETGDVTISES